MIHCLCHNLSEEEIKLKSLAFFDKGCGTCKSVIELDLVKIKKKEDASEGTGSK